MKLHGAQPFSSLFVNWAFTPQAARKMEIRVLDGTGDKIADSVEPQENEMPAVLNTRLGPGRTYTIEFDNLDTVPSLSRDFSVRGGQKRTWIFTKSVGKEYIISSTATTEEGGVRLRAYVRQLPGPGSTAPGPKQTVIVESWQGPFVPEPTPTPVP